MGMMRSDLKADTINVLRSLPEAARTEDMAIAVYQCLARGMDVLTVKQQALEVAHQEMRRDIDRLQVHHEYQQQVITEVRQDVRSLTSLLIQQSQREAENVKALASEAQKGNHLWVHDPSCVLLAVAVLVFPLMLMLSVFFKPAVEVERVHRTQPARVEGY